MRYSRGDVVEFKVGSNEKHTVPEKKINNSLSLGSREERASLLKAGFTGKEYRIRVPQAQRDRSYWHNLAGIELGLL